MFSVTVNPFEIYEKLFFSIFGQKETTDIAMQLANQPSWTIYLFKVSFSIYMLLTVIVLVNLLIAMMSDTYHSIQSQSDTEWKYGLSKLIRNMQKTTTAPSPFNLITTWASHLYKFFKNQWKKKKPLSNLRTFINRHGLIRKKLSTNNEVISLPGKKRSVTFFQLVSRTTESSHSNTDTIKINDVVDWDVVQRKYRLQFGSETEKSQKGDSLISSIKNVHTNSS